MGLSAAPAPGFNPLDLSCIVSDMCSVKTRTGAVVESRSAHRRGSIDAGRKAADAALYAAKRQGRNRYSIGALMSGGAAADYEVAAGGVAAGRK